MQESIGDMSERLGDIFGTDLKASANDQLTLKAGGLRAGIRPRIFVDITAGVLS